MKKLLALIMVATFIITATAGCSSAPTSSSEMPSGTTPSASVSDAPSSESVNGSYKIGVFLRFSDEAGTKMKATIEHAVKKMNEDGGISGNKIDVVYYDTEGDSTKAVDAFTRLVTQDKVLLAIGPTTSSCALAVIDICEEYKIPLITPQATNTQITAEYGNEWFFRNSVADVYHSYTVCDYVVEELKATKIAIMHETATLGLGQYENFAERLSSKHGLKPIIVQEWNEGDVDFKTQLLAVKAANPDVIIMAGHEAELAIAMSQRLDVGISKDIPIGGFSSMSSADFYGIAGQAAVGAIFSTTFSPIDTRPEIQEFVKEYTSVVNGSLDHNSAQAYDTIMLVADILGQVKPVNTPDSLAADRLAIRDAMASVKDWVGLTGVTTFGTDGGPDGRDGKKVSSIYQLEKDFTWSCLKAAS